MLEWLQEQTQHIRGVAIAMMHRFYWPEHVDLTTCASSHQSCKKIHKSILPQLSADGRHLGKLGVVDGLVPLNIDQNGTIHRPHTLYNTRVFPLNIINPAATERIKPAYKPPI